MSWFVRNMREVQWYDAGPFGVYGDFEQDERFPEVGFNFGVVWPGQPVALYHHEDHQEGFLVLSGECLLIVEGEERLLTQWDYFHCPAGWRTSWSAQAKGRRSSSPSAAASARGTRSIRSTPPR